MNITYVLQHDTTYLAIRILLCVHLKKNDNIYKHSLPKLDIKSILTCLNENLNKRVWFNDAVKGMTKEQAEWGPDFMILNGHCHFQHIVTIDICFHDTQKL